MNILSKSNDTMKLYYIPHNINNIYNKIIINWYFYNSEKKLARLTLLEYLIKTDSDNYKWDYSIYNEKTNYFHNTPFELHKLLEKEMSYLQLMANNKKAISELTLQISEFLGKYTFYNNFEYGWNYKCEKIHIKITIDNYKSPVNKNIQLEIIQNLDAPNASKQIDKQLFNDKELLKFLKNNKNCFCKKTKINSNFDVKSIPIKQLENLDLNTPDTLETPENNPSYIWKDWNTVFFKIDKAKITRENSNLFIPLSLEKRIMIQSCLDPRENIEKFFNLN